MNGNYTILLDYQFDPLRTGLDVSFLVYVKATLPNTNYITTLCEVDNTISRHNVEQNHLSWRQVYDFME